MAFDEGHLYSRICERLEAGEEFSLATVIRSSGSTPRKAGARMLIGSGGKSEGSIGGGILEAETIKLGLDCIQQRQGRIVKLDLAAGAGGALEAACGGQLEILLEYLGPGKSQMELYREASRLERSCRPFMIVADIEALIAGKGEVRRELVMEDRMTEVMKKRFGREKVWDSRVPVLLAEEKGLLLERMNPSDCLYIFGAGHVGAETALLASNAGFRVILVDDREEFLCQPVFRREEIDTVLLHEFKGIAERLKPASTSYALVMTRGHLHDQRVLEQIINLNLRYTGMMGSSAKRQAVFSSMIGKGFTEEQLSRVYCPVGLPIGAVTPVELAVSIIAQLIQVRARTRNEPAESVGELIR